MAVLKADGIADLVLGTLNDLKRLSFTQIAQELQEYVGMNVLLKKDRILLDGGVGIRRTLMTRYANVARMVGLWEASGASATDHLADLTVPWVHAQTQWPFERRELLMNSGKSLIQRVVEPRRIGAMLSLADTLENQVWGAPTVAQTKNAYGLPWWLTASATTGFNGGLPTDHTTVAGINITTHPNFKPYTAQYTAVTKADLISKMRNGAREIKFMSPVSSKDVTSGFGSRYRIYLNNDTLNSFETQAEQQNDQLGSDVAAKDGITTFHKLPLIWVPKLNEFDGTTITASTTTPTNPVYMVDMASFFTYVLKGDYLHETVRMSPTQHNVTETFTDLSFNFLCIDRRRNAVFATAVA
jgi:hypothetical protein